MLTVYDTCTCKLCNHPRVELLKDSSSMCSKRIEQAEFAVTTVLSTEFIYLHSDTTDSLMHDPKIDIQNIQVWVTDCI